ncbi:hypothetical protein N0V88_006319 [Collariella sp. IMI 366227]|nr:hypothetical protein N0V88_006319 [Collariella sp. IMI 366227]
MSDHRGRRHTRYDDRYDDRYYYDDYGYEHRPRHRSLGRQALDKLGDAMESLGLDKQRSRNKVRSTSSHRHRSRSRSYDPVYDYPDRYYPRHATPSPPPADAITAPPGPLLLPPLAALSPGQHYQHPAGIVTQPQPD